MSVLRPGFAEVLRLIRASVSPGSCETISTTMANGRISAGPIVARRDCPPFAMSAMDGYAIGEHAAGGDGVRHLWVGKPQFAGDPPSALQEGEARPIFTGAAIPFGTGKVLIQENATVIGNDLRLSGVLPAGANIRIAGEDARAGDLVIEASRRLNPAIVGALSAYGIAQVKVRARPRVMLLVTGDELTDAETNFDGGVIDSNGPMIAAILTDAGCDIVDIHRVADDEKAICSSVERGLADQIDMIISTGGASVGTRDLLRSALGALGAAIHFHGVHMRPGKPALFATLPGGTTVFGLPGNPVAALVAARFFVMAALRSIYSLEAEQPAARWDDQCETGPTRILKVYATRSMGNENVLILPGQQSHLLRPLLQANAWGIRGGDEPSRLFDSFDRLA